MKVLKIKDVAAAAGVSPGTASKVLTGNGVAYQVSASTIERVQRVAKELGYVPNIAARNLRLQRTGQIGIVLEEVMANEGSVDLEINDFRLSAIASVRRTFDGAIMAGLSDAARQHQLEAFVVYPKLNAAAHLEPNRFLDGRIDGLLIGRNPLKANDLIHQIDPARLPLVALWTQVVPDGVGFADADQFGGGVMAVQHLLELGHQKIAFYGSGIHSGVEHFVLRHQGYFEGLKAAGIAPKPEWHVSSTVKLLELLRGHDPVTAVFAETDTEAAAVARDVQRAGLRIPEDVSLIGFDDVFGADFIAGGLTTIYHPAQEMAAEGVKNLLALLAGSSVETCRSIVPTRVVKRHTTAPLAR
jgi:DNA-binding LacI/PurR family transcriptional regulator